MLTTHIKWNQTIHYELYVKYTAHLTPKASMHTLSPDPFLTDSNKGSMIELACFLQTINMYLCG